MADWNCYTCGLAMPDEGPCVNCGGEKKIREVAA